jgi:hypothetical protein
MGSKSSPPPAPNYQQLATQQGAANVEAARTTAKLSNPNIIGPLGTQKVTYGAFDQAGYDKAMADYNKALEAYKAGGGDPSVDVQQQAEDALRESLKGNAATRGVGREPTAEEIQQARAAAVSRTGMPIAPTKEQFTTDSDIATVTQTLTPEAQAALEAQQRVQKNLAELGLTGIGKVQDVMGGPGFKFTGPDVTGSFGGYGQVQNAPNLEAYGRAGAGVSAQPIDYGPRMGQYGLAQAGPGGPQLQGRLDTSQLAAMPINAGMTAQNAIMSRLQPQLQAQRAQLETQLANQGLVRGGEAYNAAMAEQGQKENDLLTQAALQGLNLDMAARQQGLGEQQALGGFANQAALSQFGAGQQANQAYNAAVQQNMNMGMNVAQAQNAASQQLFGQNMGIQGLYNAALSQNQQTALAQQAAQNAAQNQQFNQALQAAQFGNTASQQALQQQLALYNQPLNQIAALMSGSQIQMPQFQGYQGANVAASPVFQAGQAQAQDAMARYNAQQSGSNALMGGLFGLGGAALQGAGQAGGLGALFSDRRLKSNIVKVGDDPRGFGIYEYDIFGRRERGVMAQEVEKIIPDAVSEHSSGYKMVNYGAL